MFQMYSMLANDGRAQPEIRDDRTEQDSLPL